MHNIILSSVTLLLPALSMISGPSVAPLSILFFITIIHRYGGFEFAAFHRSTKEFIFIAWCIIACFWSSNLIPALIQCLILLIIYTLARASIFCSKIYLPKSWYKYLSYKLLYSIILAILVFAVELGTNGIITSYAKLLTNSSKSHEFHLYMLDRGCAVLSLLSWGIFGCMLQKRFYVTASFFVITILYVLNISDSLASFVGFGLGIITFIIMYSSRLRMLRLMIAGLVIYSISMPILSYTQNPLEISEKYNELPVSAKHRLFIWNFTAKKIHQKLILGWGMNSSKTLATDDDYIMYDNIKFELLPLHPHNNVLQILLELGLIGFILFHTILIKYLLYIKRIALKNQNIVWGAACYACFTTYFFISMVSFGIWQSWWLAASGFVLLFLHLSLKNTPSE